MVATLTVVSLSVDPEFRRICPELSDDEKAGLRDSIIAEGCRDPICYWENSPDGANPIVDGMNRYEICRGEGARYPLRPMQFPSRHAVSDWIIGNQLSRRNLSEEQKSYLRGKLCIHRTAHPKPTGGKVSDSLSPTQPPRATIHANAADQIAEEHGVRTAHPKPTGGKVSDSLSPTQPPRATIHANAADQIAEEHGVSSRTVIRDAAFSEAVDDLATKAPALAQAARSGEIPKSAVPKLNHATQATLDTLTATPAPQRRQAVRTLTTAAKTNGQPVNRAKWKEIEEMLGKALNRIDSLHHAVPHANLHRQAIASVKQAMSILTQWKAAVRP